MKASSVIILVVTIVVILGIGVALNLTYPDYGVEEVVLDQSCSVDSDCQDYISYNTCEFFCANNSLENSETLNNLKLTCNPTTWDIPLEQIPNCGCIGGVCQPEQSKPACLRAGYKMSQVDVTKGIECCAELENIVASDYSYLCDGSSSVQACEANGCSILPTVQDSDPYWQCTPCGNSVCDEQYGENKCNCPADCQVPIAICALDLKEQNQGQPYAPGQLIVSFADQINTIEKMEAMLQIFEEVESIEKIGSLNAATVNVPVGEEFMMICQLRQVAGIEDVSLDYLMELH